MLLRADAGIDRVLDHDSPLVRGWRLVLLVLGIWAIIASESRVIAAGESYANHLSFYTIQTNWLVVVVLALAVIFPRERLPRWFDGLRLASSFLIFMTGLIVLLILQSPEEVFTNWNVGIQEMVHHRIMPLAMLIDALAVSSRTRASWWRRPLLWMAYPVLYLAFTLVRGGLTGWYPYPFLDMSLPGGFVGRIPALAQVLVAFLLVGLLLSSVLIWRNRRAQRLGATPFRGEREHTGEGALTIAEPSATVIEAAASGSRS